MATYLSPIEKPRGLLLNIVYFFFRRQFGGKLPTPLTVYGARMPLAFLQYYGKAYALDKKLKLAAQTVAVIREQVANLNTCLFCMDIGRWYASRQSPATVARFDALANYRTSSLFTEAEKAALDYATELTTTKEVRRETFAALAQHYTEREICDIAWLVASEHMVNLTNIGFNIGSDGLCELKPPAPAVTAVSSAA